jgi:hypothetical protein
MHGSNQGQGAPTPQQLTGGVGRTGKREKPAKDAGRDLPQVTFSEPPKNYCKLMVHGWDTFTETHNYTIPAAAQAWLAELRDKAEKLDPQGGQVLAVQLGPELMQIAPHGGKGGVRWILRNDDFSVSIRAPSLPWPITVRYSSGGLWEHGLEALQARVHNALIAVFHASDERDPRRQGVRVGACHYAFDFYSPAFTGEMRAGIAGHVVCHSSSKVGETGAAFVQTIGTSARTQTLTIGSKSGLQVQVYDKTTEISEVSGKDWMREVWASNGYPMTDDEYSDVWRLELRFGGEFLKERGILYPDEVKRFLHELIAEALVTRRLTRPKRQDSNKRRWPLHPLWTAAYLARGAWAMRPLGRRFTMRRAAMIENAQRQLAGGLRSLVVLQGGDFDGDSAAELASRLPDIIGEDPEHARKVEKAVEKYRFADDMG